MSEERMTERDKIRVSFSGGRTSALMTKHIVDKYSATHEILITFANTGCEAEETLKFVDQCDKVWGWGVVWLESWFTLERGKGVVSRVVNYETASRKGEPFEWYIKKNGLPNRQNPRCTDRLKEHCMDHYTHHVVGWKRGSYFTAIGIRGDEFDRISEKFRENGFIYPLVDLGITKDQVKIELQKWPFDLNLESEAYGNCVWCWKKSFRKLYTLANESPEIFKFPLKMEAKYGQHRLGEKEVAPRVMFRGVKSTTDIIEEASIKKHRPYRDCDGLQQELFDVELDSSIGCSESCEMGHN